MLVVVCVIDDVDYWLFCVMVCEICEYCVDCGVGLCCVGDVWCDVNVWMCLEWMVGW